MFALINTRLKNKNGGPWMFGGKTYRSEAALMADIKNAIRPISGANRAGFHALSLEELEAFYIVDIPLRSFAEDWMKLSDSRLNAIRTNIQYYDRFSLEGRRPKSLTKVTDPSIFRYSAQLQYKKALLQRQEEAGTKDHQPTGEQETEAAPVPQETEQPVDLSNPFGPLEAAIKGMVNTAMSTAGVSPEAIQGEIRNGLANAKAKVEEDAAQVINAMKARSAELEQAIRQMKPIVEKHVIQVGDIPAVEFSHAHKALPEILGTLAALRKNVMGDKANIALVGPAGTGKTTLGSQVAETYGLPFHALNMSEGVSEAHLTERILPNTEGQGWTKTLQRFAEIYRDGGVFLLDEFDAADPNVLVALHSALDNGILPLPCGSTVPRHEDTIIIVTMNTYGAGADRLYTGRSTLDAATRNRFTGRLFYIDYDEALEDNLTQSRGLRDKLRRIRSKVRKAELEQIVSTRDLIVLDTLVGSNVCTEDEAVGRLVMGWTEDEKATVGVS